MPLRDYQQTASDAIMAEFDSGVRSTLVVMPTGSGKTVLFADVIKRVQPKRVMVLAHREELIWQARRKVEDMTGIPCEIEMAEFSTSESLFHSSPVVISTIQTQCSRSNGLYRMGRFKPENFGLLIIDEAHHATAPTYQNVIHYYRQNPALNVLGVTATPDRADEAALGQVFDTVAYDYEILDAIHGGWLVPVDQQMVHVSGLDFSGVRTTAGDLNGADLSRVMESERTLLGCASASIEIVKDMKTIVFTVSVAQAEAICDIFNRHKPGCAGWICGETPKDQRRQLLQDFGTDKIQVMCNCGVLTEGFDQPSVRVIVMARPTKSRSLYSQMCGRSMRPLARVVDGIEQAELRREAIAKSLKPSCLIVDFVGNSGRHKLMTAADILGGKVSDEAVERAIAVAKKSDKPVRMAEVLDEEERLIALEKAREQDRLRKLALVARAKYYSKSVNPFDVLDISPSKQRGWDYNKALSEKQAQLLQRQGIDVSKLNYSEARQIIGSLFERWNKHLCTFKQAKLLKKHGIMKPDVTMKEASEIIDRISQNKWRLPEDLAKKYGVN